MWCDKVGAGIFKAAYHVAKFLGLVAIEYDFKKKVFQSSLLATLMSAAICVFVVVVSPFVVLWNSELYMVSEVHIDDQMSLLTTAQLGFGYATSFVVLSCQLWKQRNLCRNANDFRKVLNTLSTEMHCGNIITLEMILLIVIKFSITIYEVVINFPYIIEYGDIISPKSFVAFFLNLYIAEIAAVYSDIVFTALLLLARYFRLMDEMFKSLEMEFEGDADVNQRNIREDRVKLLGLVRLYWRLGRVVADFESCIEISIFVYMLNTFTNMLVNLYALLDFFVVDTLDEKIMVYTVVIFLNICLVIHAAEKVKRSSADLKDTILFLDASEEDCKESEWRSEAVVFKMSPVNYELKVLGLFPLNNTFLLFVISYASNFVVIILQFHVGRV